MKIELIYHYEATRFGQITAGLAATLDGVIEQMQSGFDCNDQFKKFLTVEKMHDGKRIYCDDLSGGAQFIEQKLRAYDKHNPGELKCEITVFVKRIS